MCQEALKDRKTGKRSQTRDHQNNLRSKWRGLGLKQWFSMSGSRPAVSAPPGTWWKCKFSSFTHLLNQKLWGQGQQFLFFQEPSRWFWCRPKFEKSWFREKQRGRNKPRSKNLRCCQEFLQQWFLQSPINPYPKRTLLQTCSFKCYSLLVSQPSTLFLFNLSSHQSSFNILLCWFHGWRSRKSRWKEIYHIWEIMIKRVLQISKDVLFNKWFWSNWLVAVGMESRKLYSLFYSSYSIHQNKIPGKSNTEIKKPKATDEITVKVILRLFNWRKSSLKHDNFIQKA